MDHVIEDFECDRERVRSLELAARSVGWGGVCAC